MRRDFIANAAHELRTPLTNLQGYLEALRDGVIAADRATYDSLLDEAERLVRLSHSLDALAEGDAATTPPRLEELDLAMAIRAALDLAQPDARTGRPRPRRRRPGAPSGARQPRPPRTGPRQSPLECDPLHAGRRDRHRPRRTARSRTCWSRSRTPAKASRRPTSGASSSASTGSRSRAIEPAGEPGSGWPSSSSSSRPAAGGSAPSRAKGRHDSGSACRPDQPVGRRRPSCYHSEPVPRPPTWRDHPWGCSSAGRALRSHRRGQGFESPHLHQLLRRGAVRAVPQGTRASVNDRKGDPQPESDATADPVEPADAAADAPPDPSTDRRAFMRQMSRDAVLTAGRLAGLSSVVRRSVVAAGVAATQGLEPPVDDVVPSDPQPIPNVPAAGHRSRRPRQSLRPPRSPRRRRPATGTDGRAGPDPDPDARPARLPGDRGHGDAGGQRPVGCAPPHVLDVSLGRFDCSGFRVRCSPRGRPTSTATQG